MAKKNYTPHPCVTQDSDGGLYLNIFSGMFHEEDLPKWTKIREDKSEEPNGKDETHPRDVFESVASIGRVSESSPWHYDRLMSASTLKANEKPKGIRGWARSFFRRPGKPVEEVMAEAKASLRLPNGTDELETAAKAATTLHQVLLKSGQIGQAAKVRDYIQVLMYEIALVKAGYTKYLVEEDILKFMMKAEKGVYIDFLRNYKELLPLEVAEKKIEADKLMIFDNYAVMYYSPEVNPFREIVHREALRKTWDPILFGLIEGSRKLYYITDWVLKDDDLTLAKLEEVIGQKARVVQDTNIVTNITIDTLNSNLANYERLVANANDREVK